MAIVQERVQFLTIVNIIVIDTKGAKPISVSAQAIPSSKA